MTQRYIHKQGIIRASHPLFSSTSQHHPPALPLPPHTHTHTPLDRITVVAISMGTSDLGQKMRILLDEKSSHLIPRFNTFLSHFPMTHTFFLAVCWGRDTRRNSVFWAKQTNKDLIQKAIEKLWEIQERNKGWWSKNLVSWQLGGLGSLN